MPNKNRTRDGEVSQRPWAGVRASHDFVSTYRRAEPDREIRLQPWAREIVSTILQAADEGGTHLCLAWPARFDSLVVFHALANFQRIFARDLRGMRTLLFPGTSSTRTGLQGVLVGRKNLSELFRSLFTTTTATGTTIVAATRSPSLEAALAALNDIQIHHSEVGNPSLGEIVPSFQFDDSTGVWSAAAQNALERSLKRVLSLARRRTIREKVTIEWGDPGKAPMALLVLHHTTNSRSKWKRALSAAALLGEGQPEVLLLDATSAAEQARGAAVWKISEFLQCVAENGPVQAGSVVITDNPKRFFILRDKLSKLGLKPITHVWAAEGKDVILSPESAAPDWKPILRPRAKLSVGIVDRDASQAAMAFQKLAQEAGEPGTREHEDVMAACLYVLRLSNLPAGYKDLTDDSIEFDDDFATQRNAWTSVELGLCEVLRIGALNHRRADLEKAMEKARQLIDAWSDATPMASRLLAVVMKTAVEHHEPVLIVLPNRSYIRIANRYLRRKLEQAWNAIEGLVGWETLASVSGMNAADWAGRRLVFVGFNSSVLRFLVTCPQVPDDTTLLVAYRQAYAALPLLHGLVGLPAFVAYHDRIRSLAEALQARLDEVPHPLAIENLREFDTCFPTTYRHVPSDPTEHAYFEFLLEDGGRAYASSAIYRYEPNEDPLFKKVAAASIQPGDFIFDMSDELRAKVESALKLGPDSFGSVMYPQRILLKFYHDDVKCRCALHYNCPHHSELIRKIHARMVELDAAATQCRPDRVRYWLELGTAGDTRPHAPKEYGFFLLFCRALQIADDQAVQYWGTVRSARRLNQNLGRELVARYAEILFQPESAMAYRKIPENLIRELQQDALTCVFRVQSVVPPTRMG